MSKGFLRFRRRSPHSFPRLLSLRCRTAPAAALLATALFVTALLAGIEAAAAQVPVFAGDEVRVNVGRRALLSSQQVAVFPDSGFVVVWGATRRTVDPSPSVLHARFFGPDDAPLTGEFLVLPPASGIDSRQAADALLVDAAGNLLLVYEESGSGHPFTIFAQRLSRLGAPLGPRIEVSEPSSLPLYRAVAALAPDGGFVVAWGGSVLANLLGDMTSNVSMRRFDAAGNPLGPEVLTLAGEVFNPAVPAGVGMAPDGSFVVGYQQRDPATQLFAADGTPGTMRSWQYHGDLAAGFTQLIMAPDGSYVVAWTNYGVDSRQAPASYTGPLPYTGNNAGVGARMFGANGAPRRGEFEVNRFGPGEQVLGGLAPLPGGGFIAVWTDLSGRDGKGYDVYGRAFTGRRQPLTGDLRLSQATTGSQFNPVVASSGAGDVVVVWLQEGDAFGPPEDLIARRLRAGAPRP